MRLSILWLIFKNIIQGATKLLEKSLLAIFPIILYPVQNFRKPVACFFFYINPNNNTEVNILHFFNKLRFENGQQFFPFVKSFIHLNNDNNQPIKNIQHKNYFKVNIGNNWDFII